MRMIYVVGCEHPIQSSDPYPLLETSSAVKEQREHFQQLVELVLSEGKVKLVAEEWGLLSESFAQALARAHTVRWVDINPGLDDLDTLGIPRDYIDPIKYTPEQRQGWFQRRESVMLEGIRSARGAAESLLVICGFCHFGPLADRLGNGERVERIDYRNENWYRSDIFFPVSF